MASATGISQLGTQILVSEPGGAGLDKAAILVTPGTIAEARYVGFASIELFNGVNSYQVDGRSIWYQGVVIALPPEFSGFAYNVVVTWRIAGVAWEVTTF